MRIENGGSDPQTSIACPYRKAVQDVSLPVFKTHREEGPQCLGSRREPTLQAVPS
jgi:hypothetical protein